MQAHNHKKKFAAVLANALAPLQAEIVTLKAHANLQVNASTPPVQNNQQMNTSAKSDDEMFTAIAQ
jgi:hypothetical protein